MFATNKGTKTLAIFFLGVLYFYFVVHLYHKSEDKKFLEASESAFVKTQTPKIVVVDGVVSQTIDKPVEFKIEKVVIDITDKGQVITFTDSLTGNRITVEGSYAFVGYSEKNCIIRDWRKKGK